MGGTGRLKLVMCLAQGVIVLLNIDNQSVSTGKGRRRASREISLHSRCIEVDKDIVIVL